ncbi:unnamed protein product [Linum trigynum]|uniref:DOG1 domain-containing protein n=1 Tax=Linum trigynum TaxID=586398 RepID=A0AAV2EK75_9ROSI
MSTSSFNDFFEQWLTEQEHHLESLVAAANGQAGDEFLRDLNGRVLEHYEEYYRAKSEWAHQDVLAVLSPSWRTSLEEAFLWIGGWRPSTAFHILYSKSGLQFETRISEDQRRHNGDNVVADLAGLSPRQFGLIDELQRDTIKEERRLTEKLAKVQESIADVSIVDLTHTVSEMMRRTDDDVERSSNGFSEEQVERALVLKKRKMEELLRKADDLRVATLRSIVHEILTPIQAVHFLIAVGELHLRVHDWGKRGDERL